MAKESPLDSSSDAGEAKLAKATEANVKESAEASRTAVNAANRYAQAWIAANTELWLCGSEAYSRWLTSVADTTSSAALMLGSSAGQKSKASRPTVADMAVNVGESYSQLAADYSLTWQKAIDRFAEVYERGDETHESDT